MAGSQGSFNFAPPVVSATQQSSASLSSLKTVQVTPAMVSIGRGASRSYQAIQWKADRFKPARYD